MKDDNQQRTRGTTANGILMGNVLSLDALLNMAKGAINAALNSDPKKAEKLKTQGVTAMFNSADADQNTLTYVNQAAQFLRNDEQFSLVVDKIKKFSATPNPDRVQTIDTMLHAHLMELATNELVNGTINPMNKSYVELREVFFDPSRDLRGTHPALAYNCGSILINIFNHANLENTVFGKKLLPPEQQTNIKDYLNRYEKTHLVNTEIALKELGNGGPSK